MTAFDSRNQRRGIRRKQRHMPFHKDGSRRYRERVERFQLQQVEKKGKAFRREHVFPGSIVLGIAG